MLMMLGMSVARTGVEFGNRFGVEGARGRPGPIARRGERVAALFDDLAVDDLLVVRAVHEPGVLEPRHHLVEGRRGAGDAPLRERAPQIPSGPLAAAQQAEDEELKMGDGWYPAT